MTPRDRTPRTVAGERLLDGLADFDNLPPDRITFLRGSIVRVEDEAAALAARAVPEAAGRNERWVRAAAKAVLEWAEDPDRTMPSAVFDSLRAALRAAPPAEPVEP